MRILTRTAAAAALIAFLLAACGGGSSTPSSLSGADVTVHAKDTLKFDKSEYTAKAGTVKIGYVNDGNIPHTLQIDGQPNFQKLTLNSHGQSQIGSVDLPPGTYQIYCDIPGHRSAGMQANLVIQ
jgi:plastocyanin